MVSMLSQCSDNCGWAAAVLCVLSFGTFGVPVKTSVKVEVDPFILQSYKTLVCFLTSFCVVFLGEPIRWSNWGIASGLFWVPGACCGIYGIRNAGMAVAVGTWSSLIVLTSFVFGILVFEEKVKSFYYTCYAFIVLVCGLVGMARYSSGPEETDTAPNKGTSMVKKLSRRFSNGAAINGDDTSPSKLKTPVSPSPVKQKVTHAVTSNGSTSNLQAMEIEPLLDEEDGVNTPLEDIGLDEDDKLLAHKDRVVLCGGRMALTRRQLGIIGAVINGAWGGLNLIPLHYARRDHGLSGAGFLVSFATGSLIVNTVLWILLIAYQWHQKKGNWEEVKEALPKWHLQHLWKVGLAAGLLYSIGNFSALLAVTYLGQGVGFSFCQLQLLVSGLWGVFFFKEIRGRKRIFKWFMSAAIAVVGIILLSYQHEGGSAHRRRLDEVFEQFFVAQPPLFW